MPPVMYAIVDIETTGGYAAANGIIEISIQLFDGEQVVETFETLVNPYQAIPRYIQGFTGITNEMVQDAPPFTDVAQKVFELLQGTVFVAHNVNFDYSFVKNHLEACGYTLNLKKAVHRTAGTAGFSRLSQLQPGQHLPFAGHCPREPPPRRRRCGSHRYLVQTAVAKR
jgi:DNA polymerase III epsilon subunit family exonuclease